ncbi:MAG TPA: DUF1942 domain-containing protein [Mycobacterium sp.]
MDNDVLGMVAMQHQFGPGKAVKMKNQVGVAAATSILFSVTAVAPASAIDNIQLLGVQETFMVNGTLIGYTVTGLSPSADAVPYPVAGRLYEAMVTAEALQGTVTPVVPDFNARAESGSNYPVLANVSSLSGAPLGQGGSTTGKIYFDVVGDVPNSVVYNDGSHDILGWIQPPSIPPAESSGGGSGGSEGVTGPTGGNGSEGVTGSTGPNEAVPNTTATENGNGGSSGGNVGSGVGPGPGSGRGGR